MDVTTAIYEMLKIEKKIKDVNRDRWGHSAYYYYIANMGHKIPDMQVTNE